MGVIQRTPLSSYEAVQGTPQDLHHSELLWIGLGVLLGFFLVSIIFGTLETIRGNSPDAYREVVTEYQDCKTTKETFEANVRNQEAAIGALNDEVAEKEARIQGLNLAAGQLNAAIVLAEEEVDRLKEENELRLNTILDRDATIVEENARRDGIIAAKNAIIARKDDTISARNATIARNHDTYVEMGRWIADRDSTILEHEETIAGKDRSIRELGLQVNNLEQGLGLQVNNLEQQIRVARRTIGGHERDIERQGRTINFLMQENADLRAQLDPIEQQPSTAPPRADILEDLETRVAELGLQVNASQSDLRNARRTIGDLESALERKNRMIQFLNQRIAEHNVDGSDEDTDHGCLNIISTRPQTPAAAIDAGLNTSGPIPNPQVRRLVTGLQQILHLLGRCPHSQDHRAQLEGLDVLAEQMRDLVEQLNDSMFEELAQLVLDVMGHLGVKQ